MGNLLIHLRSARKGGFEEKIRTVQAHCKVAVNYTSGDVFVQWLGWIKGINGCYCRQVYGFVGKKVKEFGFFNRLE